MSGCGWPCGPMDKAPDYGSGDSRFESWHGRSNPTFLSTSPRKVQARHFRSVRVSHRGWIFSSKFSYSAITLVCQLFFFLPVTDFFTCLEHSISVRHSHVCSITFLKGYKVADSVTICATESAGPLMLCSAGILIVAPEAN